MRRYFNKTVAITAIHSELRHVNIVRERDRLDRLITHARVLRRDVIPGRAGQPADDYGAADGDLERQPVCPAWKKIRHKTLSALRFRQGTAATLETERTRS